jgi:hypothetical protein
LAIRGLSKDFELLNKKFVNRIRLPAARVAVGGLVAVLGTEPVVGASLLANASLFYTLIGFDFLTRTPPDNAFYTVPSSL